MMLLLSGCGGSRASGAVFSSVFERILMCVGVRRRVRKWWKMVHLEQFSYRFLIGFFYELGFGGGCGSGGKVVHLEQFSHRFLNVVHL